MIPIISILLMISVIRILLQIPFVQLWRRLKIALLSKYSSFIFDYSNEVVASKLYIELYNSTPSTHYINAIDTTKALEYVQENYKSDIISIQQSCTYSWTNSDLEFNNTLILLAHKRMVEVGSGSVEIFFNSNSHNWSKELIQAIAAFKQPEKEEDFEINIISATRTGLELKPVAIKPTSLDIDLYYNNDFKEVDTMIRQRLSNDGDKGIVLLHGLPGTGKTTYLRHLIGCMKKKVMFVSAGVASNLMNPEFMDLLIENPNSILIIEDAENVILDRKYSSMSSVSNLLNISDGLLSDCLNVQIICTFNSNIGLIDHALLRKGRLIAKYEFNKLSISKAQQLSNHLGFEKIITKPMTLAEITNPTEVYDEPVQRNRIGFKNYDDILVN